MFFQPKAKQVVVSRESLLQLPKTLRLLGCVDGWIYSQGGFPQPQLRCADRNLASSKSLAPLVWLVILATETAL